MIRISFVNGIDHPTRDEQIVTHILTKKNHFKDEWHKKNYQLSESA